MSTITRRISFARSPIAALMPLALLLGLFSFATPAYAQGDAEAKKQATEFYKQGTTQFKLGNFDDAIKLFKKAYATSPHHAFLFNLGQAYRQKGDCKQAIFFYKGYLAEAGEKAKNRPMVESHIEELTEICKATETSKDKPPNGALSPEDGEGDDDDGDRVASGENPLGSTSVSAKSGGDVSGSLTDPWQPSILSAVVTAGPTLLSFGENVQTGGTQPTFGISAAYPLTMGKLGINIGGMFTYTAVPWANRGNEGTSTLMSALFNVGVRYWVADKLSIGADIGGGGLFLGGLDEGTVFLPEGDIASGALSMPNFRAALAVEYLLTKNLMISAAPFAYAMSPPKDGLRADIESLTRMEFMVGMGYRM